MAQGLVSKRLRVFRMEYGAQAGSYDDTSIDCNENSPAVVSAVGARCLQDRVEGVQGLEGVDGAADDGLAGLGGGGHGLQAVGEATDGSESTNDGEQAAKDYIIIPGERVGPVTSETSRDELAQLYGEERLEDQPVAMGEGTTESGTLVNLGNDQQFAIVWRDETQAQPLLAKDFGSAWQTPEGLGVGVSFATVKSVLGNFQLYGFAWDYEGSLVLEGSNLDKYYGDLLLRVRPSQKSVEAHPKEYQAVMGDSLFASDDPNLEPLDIEVYEMTVYLNSLTEE